MLLASGTLECRREDWFTWALDPEHTGQRTLGWLRARRQCGSGAIHSRCPQRGGLGLPHLPAPARLPSFSLYQHIPSPGSQDRIRSLACRVPAGASSFSRLFSGLQISPALTLQLFLPPGQSCCQWRKKGSGAKDRNWDAEENGMPCSLSVCLRMSRIQGEQERKARAAQAL